MFFHHAPIAKRLVFTFVCCGTTHLFAGGGEDDPIKAHRAEKAEQAALVSSSIPLPPLAPTPPLAVLRPTEEKQDVLRKKKDAAPNLLTAVQKDLGEFRDETYKGASLAWGAMTRWFSGQPVHKE
jgi:hypothetical protein